ncbi:MAG: thioesterase domain-containing protein [Pseudomonadota bacterium]
MWRPRPRENARFRLICFPFAGGGPRVFQGWDDHLTPDIEFVGVRLPARDSRFGEPPIGDWPSLLERASDALTPLLDRPCAFFGHSFGARLAFLLARRFQGAADSQLRLLALSGCSPPHRGFFHPGLAELPGHAFFSRLGELGGMPAEALDEQVFLALVEPALRADIRLSETWHDLARDSVARVPVVAFAGDHDTLAPALHMREWANYAQHGFDFSQLPGGHFFLRDQTATLLATVDRQLRLANAEPHAGMSVSAPN